MNGNSITVVGNLTRDPELKYTRNDTPMVRFSVADNHRYMRDNEWEDKTSFIDCIAWGDIAENISNSLTKGARVIVVGRIDQQTWENEDGDKRSKLEIAVDSVGPELRWATADVTKTGGDNGKSSGGGKSKSKRRSEPVYDDDEEPF